MNFCAVPYEEKYDEPLRNLERSIVQGKHVQLEMLKRHFLDRAQVFRAFAAFIVLTPERTPIASAIGARTTLEVNGVRFDAGVGFDVKVSPGYRKRGIGQVMSRTLFKEFFSPTGLERRFTTIKKSNFAIRNMLVRALNGSWFYDFVYLTIPVSKPIHPLLKRGSQQLFRVALFDEGEVASSSYTKKSSGLGYFNTFDMYQLRIKKISTVYQLGLRIWRILFASRHNQLPKCGDTLSFATLFNHTPKNILLINEILDELRGKGVGYLIVCCRRGDTIFETLKPHSIYTYGYFLVADFPLSNADAVTVDVRCL